jgi:hypothetical protein
MELILVLPAHRPPKMTALQRSSALALLAAEARSAKIPQKRERKTKKSG